MRSKPGILGAYETTEVAHEEEEGGKYALVSGTLGNMRIMEILIIIVLPA